MASGIKLEVGKTLLPGENNYSYIIMGDPNKHLPPQPLLILEEKTREEWKQNCLANYGIFEDHPYLKYFYLVSTD